MNSFIIKEKEKKMTERGLKRWPDDDSQILCSGVVVKVQQKNTAT